MLVQSVKGKNDQQENNTISRSTEWHFITNFMLGAHFSIAALHTLPTIAELSKMKKRMLAKFCVTYEHTSINRVEGSFLNFFQISLFC